MSFLEEVLTKIEEAKREIFRIEATNENRHSLDDAYAGLTKAETAIEEIICKCASG